MKIDKNKKKEYFIIANEIFLLFVCYMPAF